jgi:hypothetical protein
MAKGGFLVEMLASKHATSDIGFLWRFYYYTLVGIPLLFMYYVFYMLLMIYITSGVKRALGLTLIDLRLTSLDDLASMNSQLSAISWPDYLLSAAISLTVPLALYHFNLLPIILAPVKLITSI